MATSLPRSLSERWRLTSWLEPKESAAGRFSEDMAAVTLGCGTR